MSSTLTIWSTDNLKDNTCRYYIWSLCISLFWEFAHPQNEGGYMKDLLQTSSDAHTDIAFIWAPTVCAHEGASLPAKVPIRFPPLPLGGFRQVYKHLANMRLTSFASYMLVVGSLVMYQFACIYQRSTS